LNQDIADTLNTTTENNDSAVSASENELDSDAEFRKLFGRRGEFSKSDVKGNLNRLRNANNRLKAVASGSSSTTSDISDSEHGLQQIVSRSQTEMEEMKTGSQSGSSSRRQSRSPSQNGSPSVSTPSPGRSDDSDLDITGSLERLEQVNRDMQKQTAPTPLRGRSRANSNNVFSGEDTAGSGSDTDFAVRERSRLGQHSSQKFALATRDLNFSLNTSASEADSDAGVVSMTDRLLSLNSDMALALRSNSPSPTNSDEFEDACSED